MDITSDASAVARMRIGLVTFITDRGTRPDDLARAAEERGFHSLFVCEHSNIPSSRETPYPGGGDLPPEYYRTYDPFVALALAAAATSTLRIGTGMCQLIQRDPIHTAKSVASLDQLSGGRFDFGVGTGWNIDEMRQHGTDPRTRTRLLREQVLAIKALWRDDVAMFEGELVNIAPTTVRPAPVQRPNPPVILGGSGPTVLERVLDYGDAWAVNPVGAATPDLSRRIEELRSRADDLGRGHVPVYAFGLKGGAAQSASYEEIGVDECLFLLPTLRRDEALGALDRIAGEVL